MYEKILSGREARYQLFTKPMLKKLTWYAKIGFETVTDIVVICLIMGGAVVLLLK